MLANGIDLPILLGGGLAIILPLLLFNALVESPVLARFLGVRWRELFAPLLRANIWSLLAGLPIAILNGALAGWLLPDEFVRRMHAYPIALAIGALNYYLASCLVEYLWFRRRIREQIDRLGKPLLRGVVLANLASYAVLGPVYWFLAQPKHSVKEFTLGTEWARRPPTDVVYLTPAGSLSAIRTDGSAARVLVTNQMADFVVSEDLGTVLFRTASNHYFLASHSEVIKLDVPAEYVPGMGMDFSPDGDFAALRPFEGRSLAVWSRSAGRATYLDLPEFKGDSFVAVCWSTNRDTFFVTGRVGVRRVTIAVSGSEIELQSGEGPVAPPTIRHFGRLGQGVTGRGEPVFNHLSIEAEEARSLTLYWAGGGIRASHKDRRLVIAENPGVWHFGNRQFPEVGFTGNYDELVFHDGRGLYLADLDQRRVGRLASGTTFLLLSPMYCKAEAPQFRRTPVGLGSANGKAATHASPPLPKALARKA